MQTQKIIPHLWFDTNAEEAVSFYTKTFRGGKRRATTRYGEAGQEVHGMTPGTVMSITFEIEGYTFMALNGGPHFTMTPAISFMLNCPTKGEVDELWEKLSVGGKEYMPLDAYSFSQRYGWIQDKYGVSWQLIYNERFGKRTIIPTLLFTEAQCGKAEEAMKLYTSIFNKSSIGTIARYGKGQLPEIEGTIMYADFELEGQKFAVMDSAQAHEFTFNEAVSLIVECKDQGEIDHFWRKLSAVPDAEMCGWLKDKFGVSWQIVPRGMETMLNDPDSAKTERVMRAVLDMKKFDMAALARAHNGG